MADRGSGDGADPHVPPRARPRRVGLEPRREPGPHGAGRPGVACAPRGAAPELGTAGQPGRLEPGRPVCPGTGQGRAGQRPRARHPGEPRDATGPMGAHRLAVRGSGPAPAPGGRRPPPRPWAEHGSLRVPATSVFSRADGVVHWSSCRHVLRTRRENVEVRGSHLGLGHNPAVLWLLADRLGMAEGVWTPFGLHSHFGRSSSPSMIGSAASGCRRSVPCRARPRR